jgi:hypothetical protein
VKKILGGKKDQESISPTFYTQLLHHLVYADHTGARCWVYSVEFERIFWLGVMVKLGILLLVKLKGTYFHQRMTTDAIAGCAKRLVKLTTEDENPLVHHSMHNFEFPIENNID